MSYLQAPHTPQAAATKKLICNSYCYHLAVVWDSDRYSCDISQDTESCSDKTALEPVWIFILVLISSVSLLWPPVTHKEGKFSAQLAKLTVIGRTQRDELWLVKLDFGQYLDQSEHFGELWVEPAFQLCIQWRVDLGEFFLHDSQKSGSGGWYWHHICSNLCVSIFISWCTKSRSKGKKKPCSYFVLKSHSIILPHDEVLP